MILYCGPYSPLVSWLMGKEGLLRTEEPLKPLGSWQHFDFLVSYGYQHIIGKEILDIFPDRAINLHIAYLPWNRGKDPNYWSFAEDTPAGVTIHYMDEGIDTGDIIVQRKVFSQGTLRASYEKLHREIQDLFKEHWESIRSGSCQRFKQLDDGSFHLDSDLQPKPSWDMPVDQVMSHVGGE